MIVNCQLQFKGFNNHNYYIIIIHYFEKEIVLRIRKLYNFSLFFVNSIIVLLNERF